MQSRAKGRTHGRHDQPAQCRNTLANGELSTQGSLADWQKFFRRVAKPPDRFRDRTSARLMTASGWIAVMSAVTD